MIASLHYAELKSQGSRAHPNLRQAYEWNIHMRTVGRHFLQSVPIITRREYHYGGSGTTYNLETDRALNFLDLIFLRGTSGGATMSGAASLQ